MRLNSRETSRWFTLFRRVCACLLVAALWAAPSSTAYAQDEMDKQKIVNMSKMGLGANAIKGAIGSSNPDDFQLTPEDLGELRVQGVDEEVIAYLKDNGYVEGAGSAPADDEPAEDTGETAPADEDDAGAGPAPAPAPGEESEEGETLTEEELEERVEKKIQERDREKQQAQERERKLEAAARKLPQAKRALGGGNNMQAAKQYLEYLSLNPPQSSDNWYEAKFGLAKGPL